MFFNLMNGHNINVSFLHENVFFSAELPENWTDTRETILEGMTFNLRHLGMTLVDQPKGEDLSAAAVKRIVATVRTGIKRAKSVKMLASYSQQDYPFHTLSNFAF